MRKALFNRSKELEVEIGEYLDTVNEAILIFERDAIRYIKKRFEKFEDSLQEILDKENQADEYQKDIKYKLYRYMLIPEARGDVLNLLESIDNIVDLTKQVLVQLSIEKPYIPEFVEEEFLELTEKSVRAVETLVRAMRAYFQEIAMVNDYVNKVHFYEHEGDKIEEQLKRKVFTSEQFSDFCKRVHLRYFAEMIALLADEAETISEKVSVAAIKRSI
ncbi:MAG: DUF47 domain-containing protein [Halanaerobiales bacterium]